MEREKLKKACRNGDVEQVQTLLENKSRKLRKECRDEALVEATRQGHIPIIALLLGKGARMNELSFSAMVEQKKPEIFEEFLKHGWDINSTRFQDPALRLVVGDFDCTKWLLEHGADPNVRSTNYRHRSTPLATAACSPLSPVFDLLLAHGAELDPRALFNAITPRNSGGIPVMKYLISKGIDVNHVTREKGTPLHYAIHCNKKEKIQLLLDSGADTSITSFGGTTVAEMARLSSSEEIREMADSLEASPPME